MCKVTTFWVKCQILHLKILQGHNKIVPLHPILMISKSSVSKNVVMTLKLQFNGFNNLLNFRK